MDVNLANWWAGLREFFEMTLHDFLPRFALALATLLLGWLVAVLARRLLKSVLRWSKVDKAYERSGLKSLSVRAGADGSLEHWIAQAVYILVIIAFARVALIQVGLGDLVIFIDWLFAYLPTVLAVLLILLGGGFLQRYLSRAVSAAAAGVGIEYSTAFGRFTSALIIVFVGMLALAQFGIETRLVENALIALIATLGLGAAISFGLGTRDHTRDIVSGIYARKLVEEGDIVELRGRRGTVRTITPVIVIVEDEKGLFAVPNTDFLRNLETPKEP